jgi:hypothetical protein
LLGEEFSAAINGRYLKNIIPALKLIGNHQQQDYTYLTQKQPALENEAAFRTKIHKQEKWPVPRCIALSTITTLQLLLAGSHPTALVIRTSRRWEAEGVEKEAKV